MIVLTYIIAIISLVATIANVRKKRYCFIIWLCTNLFWCIHNAAISQYAQSGLFAAYAALAAWGLIEWKSASPKTEK